jgi:hypothetical protein
MLSHLPASVIPAFSAPIRTVTTSHAHSFPLGICGGMEGHGLAHSLQGEIAPLLEWQTGSGGCFQAGTNALLHAASCQIEKPSGTIAEVVAGNNGTRLPGALAGSRMQAQAFFRPPKTC